MPSDWLAGWDVCADASATVASTKMLAEIALACLFMCSCSPDFGLESETGIADLNRHFPSDVSLTTIVTNVRDSNLPSQSDKQIPYVPTLVGPSWQR
jgi:hypothetical protein